MFQVQQFCTAWIFGIKGVDRVKHDSGIVARQSNNASQ
jgi:hypothetical protein